MRPTALLRDDPKLDRIAAALRETFGPRLTSALLFGSRARGDHRADSDYDVAVFLEGHEALKDGQQLDALTRSLSAPESPRLQLMSFSADGLARRTTLMFNIRNEGVPLPGLAWPKVIAPSIAPDDNPMKPETSDLLEKADRHLARARRMLGYGEPESGGRDAYYAALFAARALIFEERAIAPKTHDGAKTLFHDIAVRTGRIPQGLNAILDEGYKIKSMVDYDTRDPDSDYATEYVSRSADFVAAIKALIDSKH
jgi:uncharacterized protein (UPF0332 family)/predicted nucleotidyltransferase